MNDFLIQIQPALMQFLAVVLTSLIGMAAMWFKEWTGIQIEAKHREALHQALMSGAQAAMLGHAEEAIDDLVEKAIQHAIDSVPDALVYLSPDDDTLRRIAERYVEQADRRV